MEALNLNKILDREKKASFVKEILQTFELNKNNLAFKKGIYIYGEPGTGKTTFVTNILKELNYDIIKYDAGDIRNKSVIDDITKHNMSDKNIMSIFNKKIKKIAIIMDEIDGMNNGDKGGINTLIKLIRPKKTKKQKLEEMTMNPIVCIGNYKVDKKIKELMKVCNIIELNTPNDSQMKFILSSILPNAHESIKTKIINYVQSDLRKLNNIYNIYLNNPSIFSSNLIENIFQLKSYNDDTKKITYKLLNNYYNIENHNNIMNDTDRTSVGLLWHENIIDSIEKMNKKESIPLYINQLDNISPFDIKNTITINSSDNKNTIYVPKNIIIPKNNISITIMHGTADQVMPFNGKNYTNVNAYRDNSIWNKIDNILSKQNNIVTSNTYTANIESFAKAIVDFNNLKL